MKQKVMHSSNTEKANRLPEYSAILDASQMRPSVESGPYPEQALAGQSVRRAPLHAAALLMGGARGYSYH